MTFFVHCWRVPQKLATYYLKSASIFMPWWCVMCPDRTKIDQIGVTCTCNRCFATWSCRSLMAHTQIQPSGKEILPWMRRGEGEEQDNFIETACLADRRRRTTTIICSYRTLVWSKRTYMPYMMLQGKGDCRLHGLSVALEDGVHRKFRPDPGGWRHPSRGRHQENRAAH